MLAVATILSVGLYVGGRSPALDQYTTFPLLARIEQDNYQRAVARHREAGLPLVEREQNVAMAAVLLLLPSIAKYSINNTSGQPFDPDAVDHGPAVAATGTTDTGYMGMTVAILRGAYDLTIPEAVWVSPADPGYPAGVARVFPSALHYCVIAQSGDWYAWKLDPSGGIFVSRSPAAVCQGPGYSR